VLDGGKTAVSSLFLGPALKKPQAMVTVPIRGTSVMVPGAAPAGPRLVLAGVKLHSKIQSILVAQRLPVDWTVSVIDGSGALVARSSGIDKLLGTPVVSSVEKLRQLRVDATSEGSGRDGKSVLLFVTPSQFSGWSVAVGIPLDSLNATLLGPFLWVLGLTLGSVLLSLALAWLIGGRIARAVSTLRKSAQELGSGREVVVPPLGFKQANDVADAISRASRTILSTSTSLQESEGRMRSILASAKDAIMTFDDQQRVLFFNAAACVMFECSEADALGALITDFVPERFRERHHNYIRTLRASGTGFGKAVGMRLNGAEFPVEASYSNVQQPGGTLHTLILRDITGRLANIEALKRSNHDLQQFAYVASHDLKTPLRSISGFVQMLERKYAHNFEEGAQSLINRTLAATGRLEQLTDDLLAYARINSDAAPFVLVDMHSVATEVTQLLDAAINDAGAHVVIDNLPAVLGARSQLVQLLLNLVGNALKYRGSRTPLIRISAARDGNDWIVSVEDNGIGIEPKHYERIFEVFKRLHGQNEYAGTGIGLAVCRRVVHQHGGKIWVEAVPGQGSTFHFTLPAVHQEGARL